MFAPTKHQFYMMRLCLEVGGAKAFVAGQNEAREWDELAANELAVSVKRSEIGLSIFDLTPAGITVARKGWKDAPDEDSNPEEKE